MPFLDTLSGIGKTVAQKSGELAENSKLTIAIKKKEREVKGLKFQIGKYVYDKYTGGQAYEGDISIICKKIDEALEEIEKLQTERENTGVDADKEVEVVDHKVSDDSDFDITEEEEEMLKDL